MFCACPSSSWHPSLIWSAFEKKDTMSISQLWGGANRESETLKITEIKHHGHCHLKKKTTPNGGMDDEMAMTCYVSKWLM